jgi:hypothetical protein
MMTLEQVRMTQRATDVLRWTPPRAPAVQEAVRGGSIVAKRSTEVCNTQYRDPIGVADCAGRRRKGDQCMDVLAEHSPVVPVPASLFVLRWMRRTL